VIRYFEYFPILISLSNNVNNNNYDKSFSNLTIIQQHNNEATRRNFSTVTFYSTACPIYNALV
jgi:hypothetical protein